MINSNYVNLYTQIFFISRNYDLIIVRGLSRTFQDAQHALNICVNILLGGLCHLLCNICVNERHNV